MPTIAKTSAAPEMPSHSLRRTIRSGFFLFSQSRTRPLLARPVIAGRLAMNFEETPISVSTRAMTSAEIIDAMTPIESVTPKPLTGPEARMNSSAAASRVVTLESMIALHALLKPIWRARFIPARGFSAYSSLALSKTSTFASIASPMASTKPARPGSVSVEPRPSSIA